MEESVTYFQLYKLSPSATLEVAILSMSCHVVVNTASLEGGRGGGTLIIILTVTTLPSVQSTRYSGCMSRQLQQ